MAVGVTKFTVAGQGHSIPAGTKQNCQEGYFGARILWLFNTRKSEGTGGLEQKANPISGPWPTQQVTEGIRAFKY